MGGIKGHRVPLVERATTMHTVWDYGFGWLDMKAWGRSPDKVARITVIIGQDCARPEMKTSIPEMTWMMPW